VGIFASLVNLCPGYELIVSARLLEILGMIKAGDFWFRVRDLTKLCP